MAPRILILMCIFFPLLVDLSNLMLPAAYDLRLWAESNGVDLHIKSCLKRGGQRRYY